MRVAAKFARMGGGTAARYSGLTKMERAGPIWLEKFDFAATY